MADHSENPRFGRLPVQQRAPTGSALRYRVSSGRRAEDSGDDEFSRDKSLTRLRQVSDVMASDDEYDSEHSAFVPASVHGKREQERQVHPTYRPKFTIDWRAEILRFLNISHEVSNDELFEAMGQASEQLQEVESLRAMAKIQKSPPRAQVIHTVRCRVSGTGNYLDQPWAVEIGNQVHLRASQPINNFELFLERHKEIAFIVYKEYECCKSSRTQPRREHGELGVEIDASALLQREHIDLLADELKTSLASVFDTALRGIPHPEINDISVLEQEGARDDISHPYVWYFHGRREIDQTIDEIPLTERQYVDLFRDYIQGRMSAEWMAVDALLEEGMISAKYIDYLYVPGRILIWQQNGKRLSHAEAFVIREWLQRQPSNETFAPLLHVESWRFDGRFLKAQDSFQIQGLPSLEEKFRIVDLPFYPVRFASEEVVKTLRDRGRMFWKCRTRRYVSYLNADTVEGTQDITDHRYMIDIATYKRMHPKESERLLAGIIADTVHELESEHMPNDSPKLGDEFFMCLPNSIPGFNMQKKQWINLDVHHIRDVVWNTAAFDFLVINPETKTLIRAVVTNHIRGKEHTDLISGKGDGLFILLHGGPGTGKTFTAESVAEIANRPLYRVTCGDIGTKAEDVEKYLEAVLFLGKTWGCVVLLDEADVFLEQRSLVNLERNALVSVFLRVLEYYDGILILTSNRVGTFDEAFKSRIQLNLSYKTLDEDQRLQIWKNFLGRIEGFGKKGLGGEGHSRGNNLGEINAEVEALAKAELNGRQIRNAISTARNLASYKGELLGANHIKVVIKEMERFDKYLLELNDNFTPEEIQRHKMVR